MLVAFKIMNLPILSTLINCCEKTFTIGIHNQSGQ